MAAQVQLETTAAATSPDLTVLPAVENSSLVWISPWYLETAVSKITIRVLLNVSILYLFSAQVVNTMPIQNAAL